MSSLLLLLIGLSFFYLGYKFYSKFIGNQIFGINDPNVSMPSKTFKDGLDYVPTKKHILFGHFMIYFYGSCF
jgi:carbon starvation protein